MAKFRNSCLVCGSKNLKRVIDLGMHPFADTFIPESRLTESEPVYPLSCDLCQDCGQVQSSCQTPPGDRYSLYDYSYTSSNSAFSCNHWQEYARTAIKRLNLKPGSFVVEAGSNDGYLAEQFKKLGHRVLGVDPSQFMADLAKRRGVETMVDFFGKGTARKIIKRFKKAQLIAANNVFNHADSPADFARAAAELMDRGGTFVFESPYWPAAFQKKQFDQIYHEHVSYFTVRSVSRLFAKAGLRISDIDLVDYHGGSLRVFAKRKEDVKEESPKVKAAIRKERAAKVFDPRAYQNFMKHILLGRNIFLKKIYELKAQGEKIVAVGAAAKGNTFLNFYKLDGTVIDYVTDISPQKRGKYTPLTRIPICPDDIFAKYKKVYALILSWNISDILKKNLRLINPKIKFLSLK